MALRTDPESQRDWKKFFNTELKLQQEVAEKYSEVLYNNGYDGQTIRHLLSHSTHGIPSPSLTEMGIKAGHCLKMALYFVPQQNSDTFSHHHQSFKTKIPRPMLTMDVTQVDFDQFCFEWKTYRTHYNINENGVASQLFYCANDDVRRRIRIERPDFICAGTYSESQLLEILRNIVLSKISRIVHVKQFHDMYQREHEAFNEYLSRLQTKASCCNFVCESCDSTSVTERIKEQFIIGLRNEVIHREIIKTESVHPGTSLDKLLSEALTLEQSMKDQETLKRDFPKTFSLDSEEVTSEANEVQAVSKFIQQKQERCQNPCIGCGQRSHSSYERQIKCPAWGKKCFYCDKLNHFQSCCRSKRVSNNSSESKSAQMVEMTCMSAEIGPPSSSIVVQVQPRLGDKIRSSHNIADFADTGSNVCLIGPKQLDILGISSEQILPHICKVYVPGGSHLKAIGKIQATIRLGSRSTVQVLYVSKHVDRVFLSRQACIALGIVPTSFPYPPTCSPGSTSQYCDQTILHTNSFDKYLSS